MCLSAIVVTGLNGTVDGRGELLKAGGGDSVHFLVQPTVRDDPISVCAGKFTLETVKMRCFVGLRRWRASFSVGKRTIKVATVNIRSELLEVFTHESVESFVACSVLDKARFVTK